MRSKTSLLNRGVSNRHCFLQLVVCSARKNQDPTWTKQEKPIRDQIARLRDLPDDVRARTTRQLALDIRALPKTQHKLDLASALANLSTEGDFGRDTRRKWPRPWLKHCANSRCRMNGNDPAGRIRRTAQPWRATSTLRCQSTIPNTRRRWRGWRRTIKREHRPISP